MMKRAKNTFLKHLYPTGISNLVNTVENHLPGRWLSGRPIIRIGLALRVNLIFGIFVNCNWVVTRWQKYNTHLHTNNT